MADTEDEFSDKEKKKAYPSLRKLARKSDVGHALREMKKK